MARQFRKKPVVVTAEQYRVNGFCSPWLLYAIRFDEAERPYVTTIHEQRSYLADGDWVIGEPDGKHFYPCKPDIFEQTYEQVNGN